MRSEVCSWDWVRYVQSLVRLYESAPMGRSFPGASCYAVRAQGYASGVCDTTQSISLAPEAVAGGSLLKADHWSAEFVAGPALMFC